MSALLETTEEVEQEIVIIPAEAHRERETLAVHTLTCTGCLTCWDDEIAEDEMWERGI